MSSARCSACHCYSRNCPEDYPNHKNSTLVGPNCTMNSQGRHYRDQSDTTVPFCDYEAKGVKCDFFVSSLEHGSLAYPLDVSLGPAVTDSGNNAANDLSEIFKLLQQQKSDSDNRNLQMQQLQSQINNLSRNSPAPLSSPSSSHITTSAASTAPSPSAAPSMPQSVVTAAADMSARLAGLGQPDYSDLSNMQHLMGNYAPSSLPLNPLAGMGQALGTLSSHKSNQVTSVDALYNATVVNKQLRSWEFAATGQFPYKSSLKQDNCNSICFAYGSFKHLEAAKQGLVTMSDTEFLARLRHLRNVFEVACLSSNLTTFTDPSWQVAREYDARVIADIESGAKDWETLSGGLETDAIYCAKEIIELKNKVKKPSKDLKETRKLKDPKDSKICSTYNTHRSSEGCYWEHTNKGEVCVFDHHCSWCKANRDTKEKHKLIHCEHKTE